MAWPAACAMPPKTVEARVLSMHSPMCQTGGSLPARNCCRCAPAFAAPQAAGNQAELLKLLEKMNERLEKLEKRNAELEKQAQAAPDRMESCTFLGLHTLQRAGIPLNQYFSWLDREVASHMLLSRRTLFVDQDGKGTYSPSQEDLAILEQYTAVERNLLYRR